MSDDREHRPHDAFDIAASSAIVQDAPSANLALEEAEALPETQGAIRAGKLAGRSLGGAIWILAVPVFLEQLAAAFLGLFDKIIAGSLPDELVVPALDGLGIGAYIGWFIGIALTGLGVGGQAIIARAIGRGDLEEAELSLGQSLSLSMAWGAFCGVVLWFVAPSVSEVCGLSSQAASMCNTYVRVLACAMPFTGLMMAGSMALPGAGETTRPAAVSLIVNVVNAIASWALSGADVGIGTWRLPNPFQFDLHVMGIALGTALSYVVGGLLVLGIAILGVKDLRLSARSLPWRLPMVRRIVRIGVPNFFEGLSMWGVNLLVLMMIGWLAIDGLQGAHIIAVQWELLSIMPGFAIGTAAGALAGQYLGAGNPREARRAVIACTGIAALVMSVAGIGYMTLGEPLTRVISSEEVHLREVPSLLFICGTMQFFFAITIVVRQGLRGVGDTKWTFIITTVSSYAVRLPLVWLFGIALDMGLKGIWIGLCIEIGVRAFLFGGRFLHGGWTRVSV